MNADASAVARYSLSRLQQSTWFSEQQVGPSPLWNVALELRLRGPIQVPVLRDAIDLLLRRHSIFRIRIFEEDGLPYQRLGPENEIVIAIEDFSSRKAAQAASDARIRELAWQPFDLRLEPPIRVNVLKIGAEDHVVLFRIHHIATDGHSFNLLLEELGQLYRARLQGLPDSLPPVETDYFEWIAREREPEHEDRLRAGGDYWLDVLEGAPTVVDFAVGPGAAQPRHQGGFYRFAIGSALAARLRALARENESGPTALFLSCLQAVIGRMLGMDDLIVGLTVNGRAEPCIRCTQGLFANVLPIRANLDWNKPFDEFLRHQRDCILSALAWQDVPLQTIVERRNPARQPGRHPLVQVSLNYWSPDPGLFAVEGVDAQYRRVEIEQARFELSLKVVRSHDGFDCTIEYDRALFEAAKVAAIARRLTQMLEGVAERPSDPLRLQRYLLEEERARLESPPAPSPAHPLVAALITGNADRNPAAPAIALDGGVSIDRGTLDRCSNALAIRLLDLGVGPDVPVALPLARGAEMIVAQLAVMKAGGCFIPLDPAHPPERLRTIFRASGARAVIANDDFAPPVDGETPPVVRISFGDIRPTVEAARPRTNPTPDGIAYIIYTSGSTGEPKGVTIEHRSLANMVAWYWRAHGIDENDRVSVLAGPGFDSTIYEIWPAMCAGSVLVPAREHLAAEPEAVRDWIVAMGITVAFAPTPLGEQLIRLDWPAATRLRTLQVGGDRLIGRPPANLPFKVVNSYGPAEGTVVSTEGVVAPSPAAGIPDIGEPIDGVELLVLDDKAIAVPDGAPGDIHIAGPNLGRGYLGRPDLTRERFFVHRGYGSRRLYRTGDLGRRREDGRFECLGRLDRQVKIRGQRIEIGEVEHALLELEEVREAAVLHEPGPDGAGSLTAYVVGLGPVDPVRLRAGLRNRLPIAMIPGRIENIERMPLTRNGKIDREALAREGVARTAAPVARSPPQRIELAALLGRPGQASTAPASLAGRAGPEEVQAVVAAVWRTVLKLPSIAPEDNFFDLGGHSLLAVQAVGKLRASTGVNLSMRAFFQHPTVASLARWLSERLATHETPSGAEP